MPKPLNGHKIGFIGLGLMGNPMARHLHNAGCPVFVHNRSRPAMDALVAEGLRPADSPAAIANQTAGHFILLSLTKTAEVESVFHGESGLLEHIAPGTLVIDLGTTAASVTRELDGALRERGCSLLDAPVSGGEIGAKNGNLTIMAGGSHDDFARAAPILRVFAQQVTHLGPSGAGQITKMANQIIVTLTIDAVAQAFALAEAAGVEPAKVRDALSGGFADSCILQLHGQRMVERDFAPGGRATGQLKDLREACQLMEELDLDFPTLKAAVPLWQRLIDEGHGDLDHSALFKLYEPARSDAG